MVACSLAFKFLFLSTEASINEPVFAEIGFLASGILQLASDKKSTIKVNNLFIV
jgi:hypothetical protein